MRRFLTISLFTLALIVGATGAAPVAYAQLGGGGQDTYCDNSGNCNYTTQATADAANTAMTATNAAAQSAAAKTPTDPNGVGEGFGTIMTWIMSLFAWLVGVAALTLDYAVYYTVITMGSYIHKLSAIGVTWRILRDIGNIALIFGFLGIGISTILNTERLGWGKKMLPMLMVAAIFLNFSLFFTEAVIDVGNLFATQFFQQINGGKMLATNSSGLIMAPDGSTLGTGKEGISTKLMSQLGLQTIYNGGSVRPEVYKSGNTWLIGFMGILLFIVTAFVMFSLAFILIFRFVYLIYLIILSPIGFAGLAIPQLKKRADKWREDLFEQVITAPVLLLLLYIALAVITDAQFLTGSCGGATCTKDFLGFVGGNDIPGFASMLLSFLVAMGLLLLVAISAKSLSAFGADKASSYAGKLSFGLTAWGMRSTAGAGSQAASQWLRRTKFGATKTGRLVTSFADKGAKASFDVRGATAFGGLKGMNVIAGDAAKGGYRGKREETIKAHEEYNKSVRKAFDDRGATKEEEKRIAEAEAAHEAAQKVHTTASEEHTPKEELRNKYKEEVKRLAEEVRRNPILGIQAEHTAKREAVAQKLAVSEADFAASLEKLTQANADLEKAKKAKDKETKESGDRISSEKKKASLAYAESITNSPVAWAVFGSGGNTAAKKIIKDAKHTESDDEKAIKAIKASIKKEAEDAAKKAGDAGTAPATPAPAPAAGGHA